jgi:hypothetical protein
MRILSSIHQAADGPSRKRRSFEGPGPLWWRKRNLEQVMKIWQTALAVITALMVTSFLLLSRWLPRNKTVRTRAHQDQDRQYHAV